MEKEGEGRGVPRERDICCFFVEWSEKETLRYHLSR